MIRGRDGGAWLGALLCAAVGCGGDECGGGACPAPLPDAICTAGTRWSAGTPSFQEATDAWGLTGVQGVRLNVADVDGDGWADLLVRRGGAAMDDFAPGGTRRTWLLRNTGAAFGLGFEDVTRASGLLALRQPGSADVGRPVGVVAFADVDGDGDQDAYLGMPTFDAAVAMGEHSEVMLNDGAGRFALGPLSDVRSDGIFDVPAGASFVDFDRDGHIDLWVPQHNFTPPGGSRLVFMQDHLYRGDGAGGFADVTDTVGLTTLDWRAIAPINEGRAHTRAWGAAACDLNGDGTPELLAPSYGRSPNHLWLGVDAGGVVTFENRSVASGYAFDDDQSWQDNEFAACFCQANAALPECAGAPTPRVRCSANWNHSQDREPFRLGGNSGGTRCYDVDNDGDLDLLTSEIKHWWAGAGADGGELLLNTGDAQVQFDRPGNAVTGLAIDHSGTVSWDEGHMTNAVFDFDNDGFADLYVGASDYAGNRGRLFHQETAARFVEVPTADFFEHNRSHGIAVADFDRDGDLDVIVGHSRARCDAGLPNDCYATTEVRAFENITPAGNFIQLRLTGQAGTNRSAIGARVTVTAGGVTQTQEVDGGHGHYGAQADLVLHFGLAAACEAAVTVRWPDAALTTESFTLPAGHRFSLSQGLPPSLAP